MPREKRNGYFRKDDLFTSVGEEVVRTWIQNEWNGERPVRVVYHRVIANGRKAVKRAEVEYINKEGLSHVKL